MLCLRSATELCKSLRAGEVSSVDLLEQYLSRYKRFNGPINAIVATDIDAARDRARACDKALARGEPLGRLHGLPITIKDSFEVVGMPTTSGAAELANHFSSHNAVAVQRLIDAGAIVLGKTNVPYMAAGFDTYNDVYGRTHNPWNLDRSPGGSSGGPAAAVATGMTGLDIGSDIGGSVRTPAAYCGVFSHKSSYGLVPFRGHIPGPPGTLADTDMVVVGPIGRSAADLALGLEVLAGPDVLDARGKRFELPAARHKVLRDYRVAVWVNDPIAPIDAEVEDRLEVALDALAGEGVRIDRQARPNIDPAATFAAYIRMISSVIFAGAPTNIYRQIEEQAKKLALNDTGVLANWTRGAVLTHRDWLVADELRAQARWAWRRFFEEFDVLICPAMPTVAFPHQIGDFTEMSVMINGERYPYLGQLFWPSHANFAMLPATAAPVGLSRSGMPVGVQVIADYLNDRSAIQFAELAADIWGRFVVPPGY